MVFTLNKIAGQAKKGDRRLAYMGVKSANVAVKSVNNIFFKFFSLLLLNIEYAHFNKIIFTYGLYDIACLWAQ